MTRAERRLLVEKRKRRLRRFIRQELERDELGRNIWGFKLWRGPRYTTHEEITKLFRHYMCDEGRRINRYGGAYHCDCDWCLDNKFIQVRKEKARIESDLQAYLEGHYELQEEER